MKGLVQMMEKEEKKLVVQAVLDNLAAVLAFVESAAEAAGCPAGTVRQIAVAVEELYVNVANYAYVPDTGPCIVELRTSVEDGRGRICIRLRDSGKKFNPLEQEPPDTTLPADERRIGGLGIWMARKLMDEMAYAYENGENILSAEKRWQQRIHQ